MTTNAECAAAATVITKAVTRATLAAFGGGGAVQNVDPKLFVTDGNLTKPLNSTFVPNLTAAAAALTAIGQGGSQSANNSATYAGWAASVQQVEKMAVAALDVMTAEQLQAAAQVLINLSNGV